jgi:hypothetical protein
VFASEIKVRLRSVSFDFFSSLASLNFGLTPVFLHRDCFDSDVGGQNKNNEKRKYSMTQDPKLLKRRDKSKENVKIQTKQNHTRQRNRKKINAQ